MPNIVVLPDDVVSKIAAGEIVERPASVAKELIENSLDALSRRVQCRVVEGGKDLIQVTDDGSGMTREDALLSLRRHATSKLVSIDDLLDVSSFGFRGEALPSIASVSRMEILTRRDTEIAGTRLEVEGGEVTDVADAGCPKGTSVKVRDLFYNVPARRKFLKAIQTELHHVAGAVTHLALSNPHVAFTMLHNDRILFEFPPAQNVEDRLLAVFGLGFIKSAVEVGLQSPHGSVHGFVSRPENLGSARTRQLVFVNRRPVTSRSVVHAVYQGFGLESRDRHPAFVIMLEIPAGRLDVNVHPTKREIRLLDEKTLHDMIASAVRDAVRPRTGSPTTSRVAAGYTHSRERTAPPVGVQESLLGYAAESIPDREERVDVLLPDFWQLHKTYIIAQTKTGMIIVDQHTAHERILFEEMLKNRKGAQSQQLLFARPVELPPHQAVLVEELADDLERLGFQLGKYSGGTYVVEAVPAYLQNYRDEMFTELVQDMYEAGKARCRVFDELAKMLACRGAVKAGQTLAPEEMNSLLDRLFATQNPFFCPHGRPTIVRMSLDELARRFGRI
jgi:DNA mismatch repair protein MutL